MCQWPLPPQSLNNYFEPEDLHELFSVQGKCMIELNRERKVKNQQISAISLKLQASSVSESKLDLGQRSLGHEIEIEDIPVS